MNKFKETKLMRQSKMSVELCIQLTDQVVFLIYNTYKWFC